MEDGLAIWLWFSILESEIRRERACRGFKRELGGIIFSYHKHKKMLG